MEYMFVYVRIYSLIPSPRSTTAIIAYSNSTLFALQVTIAVVEDWDQGYYTPCIRSCLWYSVHKPHHMTEKTSLANHFLEYDSCIAKHAVSMGQLYFKGWVVSYDIS